MTDSDRHEHEAAELVRPYVITGGRSLPGESQFSLITLVTAVADQQQRPARLSPEERFINELLMLETPQEATRLLRKNVAKITPDFVKQLNSLAEQEEKRGNKPAGERLRQLARESGAMLF